MMHFMKPVIQYKHVFDESLESITGKDVLAHLNPLRSKPSVYAISLSGEKLVFPVKEVDKYLKRIDKFGRRIFDLVLEFDRSNSVELLDMVVTRFPNVHQLLMNYSPEHPLEHAMKRWSKLPNLSHMQFPFSMQCVQESMQTHQFTPLTSMRELKCKIAHLGDEYSHFASTLPVLFPNLTRLTVPCVTKLAEDIEENIRTVMPKLEYLQTVDIGPSEEQIWNSNFIEGESGIIVQNCFDDELIIDDD